MARQTVNTGSAANDNTGDTMRSAGTKINANFAELYTILGGDTTNSSILFGDNSIIAEGVANDFETTLTFTNPTADRTITFPDTTGTVLLSGSTLTLTAPVLTGSSSSAGSILFKEDTDNGTNAVTLIGPAATADVTLTLPAVTDTLVGKTTLDTLTNKTLASPVLTAPKFVDAGFIADNNGNEQLVFQTTSSAVNHVELTNAATDNAPQLNAVGGNTNVSLSLAAKGTGAILLNSKVRYKEETLTGTTVTASPIIPLTIHDAGSAVACALANGPSGADKGFIKKFININSGAVTITPATYGQGTTIILAQHETASLIWSGASWYSIGGDAPKFLELTAGTTAVSKVVTTDANGDFKMPDGDKIRLGTGTDMTLFHDGTNSFLTNTTGIMKIATENSGIAVTIGHTTSETTIGDNLTVTGHSTPATVTKGKVVLVATGAITQAAHAGKTLSMAEVGGNAACTFTLPAATGTGNVYKFIVGVVNTSNYIIKVADATDTIDGQVIVTNDSTAGGTASVISWPTVAASDTITLNGTTTGGVGIGDYIELTDLIANQYVVSGMLKASGTEATPFSATVS